MKAVRPRDNRYSKTRLDGALDYSEVTFGLCLRSSVLASLGGLYGKGALAPIMAA